MAGSGELVIPEEVPRMALKKGSGSVGRGRKGNEFAGESLFVVDIQNPSAYLEKDVAAIINMMQKLIMDNAKYSADGDKFICIFNDQKPIYTGKLASVNDEIQKEKMDKATVETGKAALKTYEILTEKMDKAPVEAGKAVAAVDKKTREALWEAGKKALAIYKNRTEKSKTLVEPLETGEALVKTGKEVVAVDKNQTERSKALVVAALETGEALVETGNEVVAVAIDKNQTESTKALVAALETGEALVEERCAESDLPAGVNGMHRLSDDLVGFILARAAPVDTEDIPFMTSKFDLAKLLNRSEEWIEEQRQWFKEDAARDQKIYDDFVPFQDLLRDQLFENGYVEVDEECLNQVAELEQYSRELWDDWVNSGGLAGLKFADPSDPRCAVAY